MFVVGGALPYKQDRGACHTFQAVLLSLRVFSLKKSTAGAVVVLLSDIQPKKIWQEIMCQ